MPKTKVHTRYKVNDKKVPSVTTITGQIAKPQLIHWAWKLGLEGLDYRKERDEAGSIGSLAHHIIMCHLIFQEPDTKDYTAQQIDKAYNCALSYLEWEKKNPVKPILVEKPLVSHKLMFGGTPDCYCTTNETLTLLDFKTGKAVYEDYFYQLAAYKILLEEAGHKVESCKILRIGRNEDEGFEVVTIENIDSYWWCFEALLKFYHNKQYIKEK